MNTHRHFLLGIFFLTIASVLGYVTLFKSDLKLFGDRQEISVYFPRANGLRAGDPLLVAGVRWGRVASITYNPTVEEHRRVIVTATLDSELELREGYKIEIEEATLLGGRQLTLDPGPAGSPALGPRTALAGVVALNPIDALGELVSENRAAVSETIDGMRQLVDGLRSGRGTLGRLFTDEALAEDLARGLRGAAGTFENVEIVTARLAEGRGTLGRLLESDEIYVELSRVTDNLNLLLDDARVIAARVRDGQGVVGRVLTDDQLSDDVATGVRELREIIESINSGQGTLGALLKDQGIADDIGAFFGRLADGEGLLGKLATDDRLYQDVRSFSEDLAAITAHVRAGRGSVGRIVMDEDLYDQVQAAVGLITRSLEEYREAAPISTMTSVIFGAF